MSSFFLDKRFETPDRERISKVVFPSGIRPVPSTKDNHNKDAMLTLLLGAFKRM